MPASSGTWTSVYIAVDDRSCVSLFTQEPALRRYHPGVGSSFLALRQVWKHSSPQK